MPIEARVRDDRELLQRAANAVRRSTGSQVVFGGLRTGGSIRVSATAGAVANLLTTIIVHPSQGLGGRSWERRRPFVTADYAGATDISHDFDSQILGEGITQLAVVPIIVRAEVTGLLYAGQRTQSFAERGLSVLGRAAVAVADELRMRDIVDERVKARPAVDRFDQSDGQMLAELRDGLAAVAATTTDEETRRQLRLLVSPGGESDQAEPLTPRQRDVLVLVACGLNNAQIGTRLGLSELTVKSYLRTIMARFSTRTRHEAVLQARRLGLL